MIKRLIKAIVGDVTLGALDYIRFPELGNTWGGPFNGQMARVALFNALLDEFKPATIIETGTFLGTTTELFGRTKLPTYSFEARSRSYGFARRRLRRYPNVFLRLGDSRVLLREFFDRPGGAFNELPLFAYLDAHWQKDLPLTEEIEIIFSHCRTAVVMIDDFQVPFDAGYGYDDYGEKMALTAELIAPVLRTLQLQAFYPSTPSASDGGARRGCVVLAEAGQTSERLAQISLLSQAGN